MSSNDSLDREMERTLRDYYAEQRRELHAPAYTWARVERRLYEEAEPGGWFSGYIWKRLAIAACTTAGVVVVLGILFAMLNPNEAILMVQRNSAEFGATSDGAAQTQPAPAATAAPAAPSVAQMAPAMPATPAPAATAAPAPAVTQNVIAAQPAPAPTAAPSTITRTMPAPPAAQPTPAPAPAVPASAPTPQVYAMPTAAPAAQAVTEAQSAAPIAPQPDATRFADFSRQQAVLAAEDAVSTFSLDVDRTSYFLALNWAQVGYDVEPDSVRAEEWINAFAYGYEMPPDDWGFSVTTDVIAHPLDDGMHLARIGFQAPQVADDRPLNVTLVLDASGSMQDGDRVAIARAAAEAIRDSLRPQDRIAVVHFTTNVVSDLTVRHTRPDANDVGYSISRLYPRESTNVQAGLNEGVRLADEARRERPDAYNYVILMSDGVANVDATNPFAILETAYDRDAANPLRLITIGVGIQNYNDVLLEQLAQHGNGWYRYLSTVDQARATFSRENWLSLSLPFADQTRAQVTWDPDLVHSWRIVGYENRVTPDETFAEDRKEFAEIYSGAATTVLYELTLREGASIAYGAEVELGSVELRWIVPDTQQSRSQRVAVEGRSSLAFADADPMLRLAAIVGLAADRYSPLWQLPPDGLRLAADELARLREHLAALNGDLGHLQAYHDFAYLLDRITRSAEVIAPPPRPSGYSP